MLRNLDNNLRYSDLYHTVDRNDDFQVEVQRQMHNVDKTSKKIQIFYIIHLFMLYFAPNA